MGYYAEINGIYYNLVPETQTAMVVSSQGDLFNTGQTYTYSGSATSQSLTGSYTSGEWRYANESQTTKLTNMTVQLQSSTMAHLTLAPYTDGVVTVNQISISSLEMTVASGGYTVLSIGDRSTIDGCITYNGVTYTAANLYIEKALVTSIAISLEMTIYFQDSNKPDDYQMAINLTYHSGILSPRYEGQIVIPKSVTYEGITYQVTSIGARAFYRCSGLTSITIPSSITDIGAEAFEGVDKVHVNRGTGALLQVWESGYTTPYETGTDKELPAPYISVESTTQTTATIIIHNYYKEYVYDYDGNEFTGDSYIVTGLRPEYTGDLLILVKNDKVAYRTSSIEYTTKSITPSVSIGNRTASSITVIGSYIEGDAEITSHTLTLNGVKTEGNRNLITGTGLEPNRQYVAQYTIKVNGGTYSSKSINITTDALTLTTEQPKVISDGNVIVGATSNLDDAETNIGFEWRRVDWTNDFASNSGKAYLYGGVMEGYIRNLNSNYLWKYRPYYESDSGNRYYGEWVGIDPTNTSYFEPTVHTYARISVDGNRATVSGYAQRGTDNVVSQGFMYWKSVAEVRGEAMYAPSVPKDAMKVEATGTVMEAELDGLEYETDYSYVAYMTTAEGETFYGETKSFRTGEDTTGIGGIESTGPTTGSEPAIYDLNGRKLARMQKGINILRYSDGSVKKVMMK